jgi:hypothetical protein
MLEEVDKNKTKDMLIPQALIPKASGTICIMEARSIS